MLQIIGWMGCVYLIVKGLQMLQVSLNEGTSGKAEIVGYVGVILSVGAAVIFFLILNQQIDTMGNIPRLGGF